MSIVSDSYRHCTHTHTQLHDGNAAPRCAAPAHAAPRTARHAPHRRLLCLRTLPLRAFTAAPHCISRAAPHACPPSAPNTTTALHHHLTFTTAALYVAARAYIPCPPLLALHRHFAAGTLHTSLQLPHPTLPALLLFPLPRTAVARVPTCLHSTAYAPATHLCLQRLAADICATGISRIP